MPAKAPYTPTPNSSVLQPPLNPHTQEHRGSEWTRNLPKVKVSGGAELGPERGLSTRHTVKDTLLRLSQPWGTEAPHPN